MESHVTTLPAEPAIVEPVLPDQGPMAEYDRRQQRQYNRLFVVCWLIILITGIVTLFLIAGYRG